MTEHKFERNKALWLDYIDGLTLDEIAEKHKLGRTTVAEIIQRWRRKLSPDDREDVVRDCNRQLNENRVLLDELRDAPAAPAFSVKGDLLIGPSGEVVEDHSTRIQAMREIVNQQQRQARLLGLDAPARQELSGAVRYEIVGVPDEDLT